TDTWTASRIAGSHPDPALIAQVVAVQQRVAIAVLTNNGALMAQAIRHIVPSLFPALEERVLCSGALRLRKPDPLIYREALQRLDVAAERTLFVDDMPDNVTGACAAGLHAEQVTDAASLQQVLQRYGLV
ncbi:MAG TPA: HAD-IA family hydrolase, partial [Pseudoxanthomonas sp.]|nr:HAD-IA family hydrolase [Pseudoxanthomonas sp.]